MPLVNHGKPDAEGARCREPDRPEPPRLSDAERELVHLQLQWLLGRGSLFGFGNDRGEVPSA